MIGNVIVSMEASSHSSSELKAETMAIVGVGGGGGGGGRHTIYIFYMNRRLLR